LARIEFSRKSFRLKKKGYFWNKLYAGIQTSTNIAFLYANEGENVYKIDD